MPSKTVRLLTALAIMAVCLMLTLPAAANDPVIEQANQLYSRRVKQADAVDQGIVLLDKLLATQPNNYEALWRQARFHWFKADRQTADGKKLPVFEKGKAFAERAVAANDKGVEGRYWFGSLIGSVGQEKGILNSLFMVGPMKEQLEMCIKLDPKHHDAYDVLAQLYWKVPGKPLSIGDKHKAQEYAKKATDLAPDDIGHWVLLGEIAISNKDYATARKALNKAISLPDDDEDPVSSQKDKANARKLLKDIEGK